MKHEHEPKHYAPNCQDQLPNISMVGRGPKGDSAYVEISDTRSEGIKLETYVTSKHYDYALKKEVIDDNSNNINGGYIDLQYNLNESTTPKTFTITLIYRRLWKDDPSDEHSTKQDIGWTWTSPAIPYTEFPYPLNASTAANVWINNGYGWQDKLNYPPGTSRSDFNGPNYNKPWAVPIDLSISGDDNSPTRAIKEYIDSKIGNINNTLSDILAKIYPGNHTINSDGHITWTENGKIPIGNMNIYSNFAGTQENDNYIKSSSDGEGDVRLI